MRVQCRPGFECLRQLFLFLIVIATIAIQLDKRPVYAGPPIGINVDFVNDYTGEQLFADAMQVSRQWSTTNLDANGWPNADASIYVFAGTTYDMSGTYALSFSGQATISGATVTNQVYNSSNNMTSGTIVWPNSNTMMLTFSNTKKTATSATNTGIANVKLMRPTSPGATTSYSTSTVFTTQSKAEYTKFGVLRFMDFSSTNGSPVVNWSDRTRPQWATQDRWNGPIFGQGSSQMGAAWEYAVQLCNETNTDMWINIPVGATDDYVTKLGQLIAYGSDGNLPYTSPQSNPIYQPLGAGHNVYIEFSNEVWNTGGPFTQSQTNHTAAINEVNAGGSPLNFDGDTGDWDWAARRTAKRTVEISNLFRTVFGSAAMMTRIRPVLESQQGYTGFWAFQQAHMLEEYYNNPRRVGTPHPPSYYIYGGGGSAYYNPNNSDTSLTINTIWTSASFDVNTWSPVCVTESGYDLPLYGQRIAYEGGPSMDSCGCSADTIKAQAWTDSRMTTLLTSHQTLWNQTGGGLLVYFTATGDYQWGFTSDVFNLTTAKLTGITQIDASTQATGTIGTAIPGTVSASSVAGPDFAPSPGSMNIANDSSPTWIGYFIKNASAGAYSIALSAGSVGTTNVAEVYVDGALVGTISIPNTGSNSTYATTVTVPTGALAVGSHGLIVKVKTGSFGFQSIIVTTSSSVPGTPGTLSAAPGNAQVVLSWGAASGATSYNIYRGTTAGGESGTPIATGITTTSYTNTGLTNGTTYYYKVAGVNSAGTGAQSNEGAATPTAPVGGLVKINAGGPAVAPYVADADFTGGTTATNWTGAIDTSAVINPAPQAVYQTERYGSPAMSYTIPGLTAGTTYQVRLHFCENYFTTAGSRVFNVALNGTTVLTNFDIFATAGAIHKANVQQFNVAANGSGQIVVAFTNVTNNALINGIEVNAGTGPIVTSVRFYPRSGWPQRMTGGIFQGSNDNSTWTNLVTVSTQPADNAWTTLTVSTSTHYRYLRYLAPNSSWGNVSEVEFYAGSTKLSGTGFGTAGSWNNAGNTFTMALDGNTATYFDAPDPGNGDYVGIDLGS